MPNVALANYPILSFHEMIVVRRCLPVWAMQELAVNFRVSIDCETFVRMLFPTACKCYQRTVFAFQRIWMHIYVNSLGCETRVFCASSDR